MNQYNRFAHSVFLRTPSLTSNGDWQFFQIQQSRGITVIDQFAIRCRAIQLLDEFCRHIIATKGMVRAVQQMLCSHNCVTALERLYVVADGVNVELAKIVIDWTPKTRRVGNER